MSLKELTERFTHYCRTGESHPSLKANPERLAVYLDLHRNNIDEAIDKMYPLTRLVLKDKRWKKLVDAFVAEEECSSPFYWQMPRFLMEFVKKNNWAKKFKVPYLDDLMHFEWIEVELELMPDAPQEPYVKEGNVLRDRLYFNPESRLLTYSYPVFEKKELPRPMEKGNYFLLAFRRPSDGQVYFISVSPFFATVIQLLKERPLSGDEVLKTTAKLFKMEEAKVLAKGEKFLEDLLEKEAIYGFKKSTI